MPERRSTYGVIVIVSVLLVLAAFVGGYMLLSHEEAGARPVVVKGPALDEPVPQAVEVAPPVVMPPQVEVPAPVVAVAPTPAVVVPAAVALPGSVVVYESDFRTPPGTEWNVKAISVTPTGGRPQLGGFKAKDTQPVLTLKGLPPHKLMRITFDLYMERSWDGSNAMWGPGLLDMFLGADDNRSLIHATFGNCGFFSDNNEQSFPDNYPAKPYPAWTLATEHETLGYKQDWGGPARTFDASSVYHLVLAIPHTADSIQYKFHSTLPDNSNKPYGFANMVVEAVPELVTFTPEEMAKLWTDLGSGEAQVFYDARWKMISAGDAAVKYISNHYTELKIPEVPEMKDPKGSVQAYPMEQAVIQRERARNVLEAIHTPAAMGLKREIGTVFKI